MQQFKSCINKHNKNVTRLLFSSFIMSSLTDYNFDQWATPRHLREKWQLVIEIRSLLLHTVASVAKQLLLEHFTVTSFLPASVHFLFEDDVGARCLVFVIQVSYGVGVCAEFLCLLCVVILTAMTLAHMLAQIWQPLITKSVSVVCVTGAHHPLVPRYF